MVKYKEFNIRKNRNTTLTSTLFLKACKPIAARLATFRMKFGSSIALLGFGLSNAVCGGGNELPRPLTGNTSNRSQPCHGSVWTKTIP